MLCLLMMSISSCKSLSLTDYCQRYNEIIIEKGDSNIIANNNVKKRIAANEIDYKCNCKNIKADYCELGY